jgi:transposase
MSLRPHALEPVPEETARVARAAFPKGNPYLLLRDALGTLFRDDDFAPCFPPEGQPGLSPWRLALITIMQFRENLADRQAAEAVRARIDWRLLLDSRVVDLPMASNLTLVMLSSLKSLLFNSLKNESRFSDTVGA